MESCSQDYWTFCLSVPVHYTQGKYQDNHSQRRRKWWWNNQSRQKNLDHWITLWLGHNLHQSITQYDVIILLKTSTSKFLSCLGLIWRIRTDLTSYISQKDMCSGCLIIPMPNLNAIPNLSVVDVKMVITGGILCDI